MASTPLLDDYVTREQLAEELKITTRTLAKWAVMRAGPPRLKIGARVYYAREDVRSWMNAERERARAAA